MEANVLYSPEYRHFALWLGEERGSKKGHGVTAVSKHCIGPFEAVSWKVPGLCTCNQFEIWRNDASGAVYAAINIQPGLSDMPLAVVQLSPDLLSVMPNRSYICAFRLGDGSGIDAWAVAGEPVVGGSAPECYEPVSLRLAWGRMVVLDAWVVPAGGGTLVILF